MTQVNYNPDSDGYLSSSSATFTTARDGNNVGATLDSAFNAVSAAPTYDLTQYLLKFSHNIPAGSTIDEIGLSLKCSSKTDTDGSSIKIASYDHGAAIDATDWRNKTALDGLTVLNSKTIATIVSGSYNIFTLPNSLITPGTPGTIKLIIWDSINQGTTAPSGDNRAVFKGRTASGEEPVLYVNYTPPNSTPGVPTAVTRTGVQTDTTPNFSANVTDPDSPSEQIRAEFEITTSGGGAVGSVFSAYRSGNGAVTAEYGSALSVGQYRVRARANDDSAAVSAYSGYTNFNVENSLTFDSIYLWDVQAGTPVQFDSVLVWNVLTDVQFDSILVWDVEGPQPFMFESYFLWDTKEDFQRETDFLWNVIAPGTFETDFLWNTSAYTAYDLIFKWNMDTVWVDVDELDDALWTEGAR